MKESSQLRHERLFSALIQEAEAIDAKQSILILKGMEILALELYELNVASSELNGIPDSLADVVHHLEQIDQTLEDIRAGEGLNTTAREVVKRSKK